MDGLLEQQGGAAGSQYAIADLGHFQVGRYRMPDALEFARTFKLRYKVSEVTIFHRILPIWLHLNRRTKVNIDFTHFIGLGQDGRH